MTLTETFALVSFSIFSYADLRYRLVPGIEVFLLGTILLTFPGTPIQTGIVLLACIWGIIRKLSGWFALPLLFYPPVWPILFTGYGYRKGMIGRADLLAISGIACLFPFPAVLLALIGLVATAHGVVDWHRYVASPAPPSRSRIEDVDRRKRPLAA